MVSPFMSFATGALGAVNNQINKYQQTQAAEKLAEQEEQRELNKLEFDRATKELILKRRLKAEEKTATTGAEARLDAARINAASRRYAADQGATSAEEAAKTRAKSAAKVAGINKEAKIEAEKLRQKANRAKLYSSAGGFEWLKGASERERVVNPLTAFVSEPEKFEAAYNDAKTGPELKRKLLSVYQMAYNLNSTDSNPDPDVAAIYSGVLKGSPFVRNAFLSIQDNTTKMPQTGSPEVSQTRVLGNNLRMPDTPEVKDAIASFSSVRRSKMNPAQAGAEMLKLIGPYDPGAGNDSDINKLYVAASSPTVKYFSQIGSGTEQQIKEAREWLYNPDNGFVNEDGTLKDEAYSLVSLYGRQNASFRPKVNARPQPKTIQQLSKNDTNIKAEIKMVQESRPLASAAKNTLNALREQVEVVGVGSSILTGFQALMTSVPSFVKNLSAQAQSVIDSGTQIRYNTKDNKPYRAMSSKTQSRLREIGKKLSSAEASQDAKGVAAAQVEMLQNMLAYQLTSILQGGTGGRTISDTDVERALKMMGGPTDNLEQTLQKLDFVANLINNTISKGRLYEELKEDKNAALYDSVKKFSRVLGYTDTNVDGAIARQQQELGITSSSLQQEGAGVVTNLLSRASQLAGNNFNPEVWRGGIETVTKGRSGEIQDLGGKPYVVNPEARQMLKRLEPLRQQQGISSDAFIEGLKRVQDMHGQIFDVTSGKLVNIKYDADGSFNIVPEKPEQVEDPASRGGFGLGERLNKLFGGEG